MTRWRSESGQVVPLGAAMVGLVAVLSVAVGELAADVIDAARARTAADAAALAGVTRGRTGAERVAAANGADLVGWVGDGRTVTVTVRIGDAEATAKATDEP